MLAKGVVSRASKGSNTIMMIGLILITLAMSSLAVDVAYALVVQNHMQTTADAAALSGTMRLFKSTSGAQVRVVESQDAAEDLVDENMPETLLDDEDITLGYINPSTKSYDPNTFETPNPSSAYSSTAGYNAVRVKIRYTDDSSNGELPTLLAKIFGVDTIPMTASSVSLIDSSISSISNGGLRPLYVCQNQFNQANADGNPSNNVVRVYGDKFYLDGTTNTAGCPSPGSGNWGFADLRNCSPNAIGNSTLGDWWATGYPGTVNTGQCYSTQPGNSISSNNVKSALDALIANHTVILLPLFNSFTGTGSNTSVNISGFTGFVIDSYVATGNANNRYIQGHFVNAICKTGCTTGTGGGGTSGVAVIKLRLAADQQAYENGN